MAKLVGEAWERITTEMTLDPLDSLAEIRVSRGIAALWKAEAARIANRRPRRISGILWTPADENGPSAVTVVWRATEISVADACGAFDAAFDADRLPVSSWGDL